MTALAELPVVTTRDLKQNPAAVVRRVLELGEHIVISHGRPTGVRLVPDQTGPRRWVSGADLNTAELAPLSEQSRAEMKNLPLTFDDYLADLWSEK